MWPIRIKSTKNHHNNQNNKNDQKSPRTPPNPDFNPQSFKDIESLFPKIDLNSTNSTSTTTNPDQQPSSSSSNFSGDVVKRRSVFHRVHLASRVSRAFSARPKPSTAEILTEPPKKEETSEKHSTAVEIPTEEPKKESGRESENLERSSNVRKNKEDDDKKINPVVVIPSPSSSVSLSLSLSSPRPRIRIPGAEKRVVVYVTSLRVVRSTFEACRTVRSILQGFRVPIDERDLTMDASFFEEIRKIMIQIGQGGEVQGSRVDLPRVFIGGRYIGGADEVVELHEIGELKKLVKGLPAATPGCAIFAVVLGLFCAWSATVAISVT
ncbi:hypothetical protein OSB04_023286 [Centaurea solstitialis]|uniref:Glutaredoxin domain-containing protein n=1 Tax=Centaurea solstitialis TaxID=347529 RepID=A0AA38SKJ0_9ASTR|nr:hypothetical protein OSB04_023286 [Centaurea solstitialis]